MSYWSRSRLRLWCSLMGGLLTLVVPAAAEEPYRVGVWFYTYWTHASIDFTEQRLRSEKIYGRYDPWNGVRDMGALRRDPWKLGVDFSVREPLLGYYDLLSPAIMDMEIEEASSRGIGYFAFYWYWNNTTHRETGVSSPLKTFKASRLKSKIRFLIAPILAGKPTSLDEWKGEIVPRLVDEYVSDPDYLRTPEGRPVIFDFHSRFENSGDQKEGLRFLRESVRTKTGADPLILEFATRQMKAEQIKSRVTAVGADGAFCFHFGAKGPHTPYAETVADNLSLLEAQDISPYVYVPCGTTGIDYRVNWGLSAKPGKQVYDMPYNTGVSPKAFGEQLEGLKRYIDAKPDYTLKMLTLYAWNEWGEGGIIEPSKLWGYALTDEIQKTFGLKPRSAPPEIPAERATFVSSTTPLQMTPGQSFEATLTFRNTGEAPWKPDVALASVGATGGPPRVDLPGEAAVAPGGEATFHVPVVAPRTPGTYNFQWRMVDGAGRPFGDFSFGRDVTVR